MSGAGGGANAGDCSDGRDGSGGGSRGRRRPTRSTSCVSAARSRAWWRPTCARCTRASTSWGCSTARPSGRSPPRGRCTRRATRRATPRSAGCLARARARSRRVVERDEHLAGAPAPLALQVAKSLIVPLQRRHRHNFHHSSARTTTEMDARLSWLPLAPGATRKSTPCVRTSILGLVPSSTPRHNWNQP